MPVINLTDLPLDVTVQVNRYRPLHSDMGDYFLLECVYGTTTVYVRVMGGYVFKYLVSVDGTTNAGKFNLIRVTIPEMGGYEISINNDYAYKTLR
jgi:hypothetical protein